MGAFAKRILVLLGVTALVVVGLRAFGDGSDGGGNGKRHLTATFATTTSLYQGAQVKVLGVQVGTVDAIEVVDDAVQVTISYDDDVQLPADVHAVVVPPSIVGDRFVQLTPAYTEGAELADGAALALDHTSVPLELDDTYRALDQVASALGPKGANKDGALSRLIRAGAKNLDGNGRQLNSTIRALADALDTLSANRGHFSGTTRNLARLNKELAGDDPTIRHLVTNLVTISTLLNGQRDRLRGAVTSLDGALDRLGRFTKGNKDSLTRAIRGLTDLSHTLASHTAELEEITDLAPIGLVSLMNTYAARNWDPSKPYATNVEGRTGSQVLHSATLNDLDVQLAYTLAAVCAGLPPAQQEQLGAFCSALEDAGGSIGGLLAQLPAGAQAKVLAGGAR